jgi:hypothetical protein
MSVGAQSYYRASRSPRYSILFALPLLLGYEVLSVALTRAVAGIFKREALHALIVQDTVNTH